MTAILPWFLHGAVVPFNEQTNKKAAQVYPRFLGKETVLSIVFFNGSSESGYIPIFFKQCPRFRVVHCALHHHQSI